MSHTLTHANARLALAALLLVLLSSFARARQQTAPPSPPPAKEPATVSGRVTTAAGKPAREVPVVLMPAEWAVQRKPVAKGSTDEDGRYKLTNVPPGRYHLTPVSPSYVFSEAGANVWQAGKIVNVAAGDELKDLDFTLVRGGAVTGRVTDSDGRPVVEQAVSLILADPRERKSKQARPAVAATDDRGVYRAWGLPPGRYIVYAGVSRQDIYNQGGYAGAAAFYPQSFYPSVADESQAKAIDVPAAGEVEDVDITLGKMTKPYEATGRVLDEDGRAVVGAEVSAGPLLPGERRFFGSMFGAGRTDERGEFRVRGLTPGDWGVWASPPAAPSPGQAAAGYSDPVIFEINDSDASGLEIKMRRGAEVAGVIQIEGTADPAVLARLKELRFGAWVNTGKDSSGVPNYVQFQPAADGSFVIRGLRPGRLMFDLEWPRPKGFSLLYVRRDGVEQREGLEIRAGERVRNVQVAYAYGTAVVRGEVQFKGGARPAGVTYVVQAYRPGGAMAGEPAALDSLGRFQLESLSAGEYELTLADWSPNATNRSPLAKASVTVPAEGEVRATLVYDMTPRKDNE